MIIFTYRPKTPSRKDSGGSGGSPSRKISNTSVESYDSPDLMTRSLSRCSNSSRKNEGSVNGRKKIFYSGTKSLGRSSGISFLNDLEHTVVIFFSVSFLGKFSFWKTLIVIVYNLVLKKPIILLKKMSQKINISITYLFD